ncbi:MAG TPA: DegV family protein [Bacillota bacterium]|nr:DegV family protein [Bacillota bacterium]
MKKLKIITDSTCDLPIERIQAEGIGIVPFPITFGVRTYRDMGDLGREEFYQMLTTSSELPHTSQPTPSEYREVLQENLNEAEELILLTLSSGLSGAYESAVTASELLEVGDRERVSVVDTRAASLGQGLLAVEAAEMVRNGKDRSTILKSLDQSINRLASVFTLDTLAYLEKGGRIGKVQAMMGTMLNVKPVLKLDEAGKIVQREKVRGRKQSIQRILDIMAEDGKSLERQSIGLCHARALAEAQEVAAEIERRFLSKEVIIGEMSATIGTHVGPGCLAFFYMK